ncbi:BnaCnng35750D [Brassica napus]|uniref:BnaCnng35750D protein n=2 Tax=Brassica napus TaxID=3708 RepID=A0A078E2K1_BRANA|nr:BnaCnng35750D [Brassica napus]
MDLQDVLTAAQAAADSAERAPAAAPFFSHEQNNHQAERLPSTENAQFDHQNSSVSSYGDLSELQRPETSSFERHSPDQDHQQMRLPSMENDPYYSYPNFFTSQNPDRSLGFPSFSDKAKPAHIS